VLDDAGHVKAVQREDGASMFRSTWRSERRGPPVAMGVSSRALLKRAKDNPNFFITSPRRPRGNSFRRPAAS